MRRLLLVSLAAVAVGLAGPASAEVRTSDMVRLVSRSGLRHPYADASGRVPMTVVLPKGADADALGLLPIAPGLGAARIAPEGMDAFLASHPGAKLSYAPPLHTLLDQSAKLNRTASYRARTGREGKGVVVGVIDTGLDVTHQDFRDDAGHTRVAWLLDMSRAPLGKFKELEQKFGCVDPSVGVCAVYDAATIDAAVLGLTAVAVPKDEVGHGTHVASIAAGDGGAGAGAKYVGGAPGATLVIARVTPPHSDSVADADIVTGARFIFDRADAMGMPAVVNISLGGDYGPHDGTSALEKGLAALVGPDHPGHSIVVAAGNSAALYTGSAGLLMGVHTEVHVGQGGTVRVPLLSPGEPGTTLDGAVDVWITFRPGDDVSVGLAGPDKQWIDQVVRGDEAGYAGSGVSAGVINGVVDELSQLTSDTVGAVVEWSGQWPAGSEVAITLEGHGTAEMWLQASRDAAPGSTGIGQQFEVATKEGTINVPATHPDLIAVGCTMDRVAWFDAAATPHEIGTFGSRPAETDMVCYFSSAGPTATGVAKPDVSAPGGFVAAAMSQDARPGSEPGGSIFAAPAGFCPSGGDCMLVDGSHALLSGTSMSAPQVTGAVALLLERDPALTQQAIATLLQAGSRHPKGAVPLDFQLGPGALDVEGMMAAYDADVVKEPDPAASWMALSTSYARPDPSWPIVGTVEVRAADGSLADGFDARELELATTRALVKRPLTRIAPGLYRFEVAADDGAGQQTMTIDVSLRGTTIGGAAGADLSGHRSLPIGVDTWIAHGDLDATGGCSVPAGRGSSPGRESLLALGFVAALRARRRARPTALTRPRG